MLSNKQKLQELISDAFRGYKNVDYFIVGDSTRAGSTVTDLKRYVTDLFGQVGLNVKMFAESAQTGDQFINNISSGSTAKLSYMVSQMQPNGENTIIEASHIINDYNAFSSPYDHEGLKAQIRNYLLIIQENAPEALIIIGNITCSGSREKTDNMQAVLSELSAEHPQFFYIDGIKAMQPVYVVNPSAGSTGNAWYHEPTHINDKGGRRLYNNALFQMLANDLLWWVNLEEYDPIGSPTAMPELAVTQMGLWNQGTGAIMANSNWRSLATINVTEFHFYELEHFGERVDIIWMDASGVLKVQFIDPTPTKWILQAPKGATQLKVNLSSDGTTYDTFASATCKSLIDVVSYNMPSDKINIGLNLKFK